MMSDPYIEAGSCRVSARCCGFRQVDLHSRTPGGSSSWTISPAARLKLAEFVSHALEPHLPEILDKRVYMPPQQVERILTLSRNDQADVSVGAAQQHPDAPQFLRVQGYLDVSAALLN